MRRVKQTNYIFGLEQELAYADVSSGNIFYAEDTENTFITDSSDYPAKWMQINNGQGAYGSFISLLDTPIDYTDSSGKLLAVNSAGDGIEFSDIDGGAVSNPVENSYESNTDMFADQVSQTESYFQYVIDTDTYYEYLGTSIGDITDYRELSEDEVTVIKNVSKKPVHKIYANVFTMFGNQKKQRKGYLYRTSDDAVHYEYLGTRNGDSTDYVVVGGSGGGTPAGANTQVQFNNSTSFGASSSFVWDDSTSSLIVGSVESRVAGSGDSGNNLIVSDDETVIYGNTWGCIIGGNNNVIGTDGASLNDAVLFESLVGGWNSTIPAAKSSLIWGQALASSGSRVGIVGVANVDLTQTVANKWTNTGSAYNPRFIVGVGNWNSDSETGTRANGLVVMSDGVVSAPEQSISNIDSPTVPTGASANFADRVLITKEYGDANYLGAGGTELIDEGNGNGLVTTGRNPANFGNVGLNAVDLSVGSGASSVRGATGLRAVALGYRAQASGEDSFAWGYDAKATGDYSFATVNSTASGLTSIAMGGGCTASSSRAIAMGFTASASNSQAVSLGENTTASGQASTSLGVHTFARSRGELSAGRFGTDTANRAFNFGNGTSTGARADIMTGLQTGLVTVPQQTIALIDTDDAAVVTKEYGDANYGSAISRVKVSLTANQIKNLGTTPITLLEGQGAGTSINPLSLACVYNYGTTPFDSNTIDIQFVGAAAFLYFAQIPASYLSGTSNETSGLGVTTGIEDNVAIEITGTDSVATGDSTIDLYLTYEIITL